MASKKLIPEKRRDELVELINKYNTISISKLKNEFNVSEITIHRDLSILEQRGLINKIYGGGTKRIKKISEVHYLKQISRMLKEKRNIAAECVKRIENDSVILLHDGTTCLEIAKNLNKKNNLKIITYFPPIIEYLWKEVINKDKNFEIYCPGGKLNVAGNFFAPDANHDYLKNISVDLAFIGVIAIDLRSGLMVTSEEEARVLKSIMKVSKKIIAPIDHSKFSKSAFFKLGLLNKINEIITDKGLSDDIYNNFKERNFNIIRS